jgi:hypothetical protein
VGAWAPATGAAGSWVLQESGSGGLEESCGGHWDLCLHRYQGFE